MRMIKFFYIAGFLVVFGLKYFYSSADVDALKWILAPTAWLVNLLSGITFEYESHIGYISHHFKFIIAKSCSGVQFMIITMAALIFSFTHRMETIKKGFYWFVLSLGVSYVLTIFVNSLRIILSIYFNSQSIYAGWLTPERLHTVIGIAIYFASFIFIYNIAALGVCLLSSLCAGKRRWFYGVFRHLFGDSKHALMQKQFFKFKCIPPLLWYFAIALGIPFLNKAYKSDGGNFMEYAVIMIAVCSAVIIMFCIGRRLWQVREDK